MFKETALDIADLLNDKHLQYGDTFKETAVVLRRLYPDGIKPQQYSDVLYVLRIYENLVRALNMENSAEPWRDIAGFAILALEAKHAQKPAFIPKKPYQKPAFIPKKP